MIVGVESDRSVRIHYMDAMRSVLMTLGVVLHSAAVFSPQAWLVQSGETSVVFEWLREFIHYFRMPAFFIVSGFFCALTLKRYGYLKFLKVRLPRIVIPLLVTALTLNIAQQSLLESSGLASNAATSVSYWVNGEWVSHLWFLNCLIYYFLFACVAYEVIPGSLAFVNRLLRKLAGGNFVFFLLVMPVASMLSLSLSYRLPEFSFTTWDFALSGSIRYLPFFLFGCFLSVNREFLSKFVELRWWLAFLIVLLMAARPSIGENTELGLVEKVLLSFSKEFIVWGLCSLCFYCFYRFFNKESSFFAYFSEASYSIYLFHHIIVVIGGILLLNIDISIFVKFVLLVVATFSISALVHHFLILKYPLLRYLYNGKSA